MLRNQGACAQLNKILYQWQLSICINFWYKIPKMSSGQSNALRIDFGVSFLYSVYLWHEPMLQFENCPLHWWQHCLRFWNWYKNKSNYKKLMIAWVQNKLFLNIAKSFFSVSSNIKNYSVPNISIRGQNLPMISQTKFLRIFMINYIFRTKSAKFEKKNVQ